MTEITRTTDHAPKVWLGCLQCYNEGRLVGDWYPATDAATISPSQLHGRPIRPETHEELWVMDHENLPVDGEMDPMTATVWGECFDELDNADMWPAVCAWVRSGSYVAQGDSDLPVLGDFEERCCGTWDSFLDYATDLAEDCGPSLTFPKNCANTSTHGPGPATSRPTTPPRPIRPAASSCSARTENRCANTLPGGAIAAGRRAWRAPMDRMLLVTTGKKVTPVDP